jgi:hypothetical protein
MMEVDEQGAASARVDTRRLTLSPFSRIHYRFEATLEDGSNISSASFSFEYDDQRFEWQTVESGVIQVHWYGEDAALGQEILNIAQDALQSAQGLLNAPPPEPLRIYAYTSSQDLQSALQLAGQSWAAGHAAPELGMILISVPTGPERKLELERQLPHEIMHLLQYQVMGNQFVQQPVWLIEGMASLAELYPNPEYRRVLEATAASDELLPMETLCAAFPREAGAAFLAYAQSESFTRFLQEKYGTPGLRGLVEQYANGLGCEEAVSAAYGTSLGQLEYRWKQESLGINSGGLAVRNLSPYLLVSLLVLVPAAAAFWPYRPRPVKQARGG